MTTPTEETMTVSHSRVNFSHLPGLVSQKPPKPSQHPFPISLLSSFFDPGRKWIVARDMQMGGQKVLNRSSHSCGRLQNWPRSTPLKSNITSCFLKRWSLHTSDWFTLGKPERRWNHLYIGACPLLQVLEILWPPSCEWAQASLLEDEIYVLGCPSQQTDMNVVTNHQLTGDSRRYQWVQLRPIKEPHPWTSSKFLIYRFVNQLIVSSHWVY